jgi:hypothetical protein
MKNQIKKSRRLNGLQALFLVGVGCLFGSGVFASADMINDGLEYPAGVFAGNDIWGALYIQDAGCYSGSCVLLNSSYGLGQNGGYSNPLPIGQQSFWLKPLGTGNFWAYWIETTNGYTSPQNGLKIEWNGATFDVKTNGSVYTTIAQNVWVNVVFDWDCVNRNSYDGEWRVSVDGGNTFSDWKSFDPSYHSPWAGLKRISYMSGSDASGFLIDTFGNPTPPIIEGNDPIIAPTTPPDGENTTIDFDNFDIQGTVTIPTANDKKWYSLRVYFKDTTSIDVATKEIFFPQDLLAGQSYQYDTTFSLPNATSTSVYAVSYLVSGYLETTSFYRDYFPPDTYVGEGGQPYGAIPLVTVAKWQPPTLENCDDPIYNFLEKMTCKISNAIFGLVIPSEESVNNLFGTFQQFNTRFPFSYVNEILSTLKTISSGLNGTASITIKVFGQQGDVSLAFWNTPTNFYGQTTTIGGYFKILSSFFLYLLFLFWGLSYLHRIL